MDSKMPELEEVADLTVDCVGEPQIDSPVNKLDGVCVEDEDRVMVYSRLSKNKEFCDIEKKFVPMFETAGPRKKILFEPSKLNCGIVTCGGLCPGLNDIIRTVVLSLLWQYGVNKVMGFSFGYAGLSLNPPTEPFEMTPLTVDGIQHGGGTILGSSRGAQEPAEMVDALQKYKIGILFTIGGDGTFSGAHNIAEEIKRRGLSISVIGIPKTIDNDIYCSERTFGFSTAVGEARRAIYSAHEEAKAAYNGIGLVKLMGRDSGFISAYATLANSDVNFCLVPEVPFELYGEQGLLPLLEMRLKKRKHAVIVVAEGAGQHLIDSEGRDERDASGNVRYKDIGAFLKKEITDFFNKKKIPATIKYIDPSYMIRSCPANADDSAFCLLLGQNAVHAGMAGKTDIFIGYWNHHFTHVPLRLAVKKKKQIDPQSELWQTLCRTMNYSHSENIQESCS